MPRARVADDVSSAPFLEADRRRGRGARTNRAGRYEAETHEAFDDGWESLRDLEGFKTTVQDEQVKSIIARNDSPDLSFDRSINPYRGCEHGCIYCYARPTHAYLGHSPGLDFETKLYAKKNAAERLRDELAKPGYQAASLALGAVTDPYQPIEKRYEITRELLEVLEDTGHPVGIVTKSHLVTRDIDILSRMAAKGLAKVAVSITTLDRRIARRMEPRAATPERRLDAVRALTEAGIPTSVMVAPVVPGLTDNEIEQILAGASKAGARSAGYVLLRLPLELKELFREWLVTDFPDRANRVINLLQDMHGGADYRSDFGVRQRGSGPFAQLISQRFRKALERNGMTGARLELRTDLFRKPARRTEGGTQLNLL
ncbi:MAG: PA0069 family radical SAM protein [Pseudomonadota bacterium]